MIVILLGAPGAGKGTQAEIIAHERGIPKLSTGEMVRSEIELGTDLGGKIKELTNAGHLVSDVIITEIIKKRLSNDDCKNGFILDGYPRTVPQAEELDKILLEIPNKMKRFVIAFSVDEPILVKRLTGRFTCKSCGAGYNIEYNKPKLEGVCDRCGGTEFVHRKDDDEESVKVRLKVYKENTAPLIDYYRNKNMLYKVDGAKSIDVIKSDIKSILDGSGIGNMSIASV